MPTTTGASQGSKRTKPGGRKRGTWTHVQPEQIRAFRAEHEISRYVFSKAVGVNPSTILGWEVGEAVATPESQERLAELMSAGPDAVYRAEAEMRSRGRVSSGRAVVHGLDALLGNQLSATGMIVAGYLTGQGQKVTQEQLVELVRAVRAALSAS